MFLFRPASFEASVYAAARRLHRCSTILRTIFIREQTSQELPNEVFLPKKVFVSLVFVLCMHPYVSVACVRPEAGRAASPPTIYKTAREHRTCRNVELFGLCSSNLILASAIHAALNAYLASFTANVSAALESEYERQEARVSAKFQRDTERFKNHLGIVLTCVATALVCCCVLSCRGSCFGNQPDDSQCGSQSESPTAPSQAQPSIALQAATWQQRV